MRGPDWSMSIKSKQRVRSQGEVFTADQEVSAMLAMVRGETLRVEAKFLEPACGSGNFLAPILEVKLDSVGERYKRSQLEYERSALIAAGSIYGIDLLLDNVEECRTRLLAIFHRCYEGAFGRKIRTTILESATTIIDRNVIWGDTLSLKTLGGQSQPIVFPAWSRPFNDSMIKCHDYYFAALPQDGGRYQTPESPAHNGRGGAFIPRPHKSYPLTHMTRIVTLW